MRNISFTLPALMATICCISACNTDSAAAPTAAPRTSEQRIQSALDSLNAGFRSLYAEGKVAGYTIVQIPDMSSAPFMIVWYPKP